MRWQEVPERIADWHLTQHARKRIAEMGLDLCEVERTVRWPVEVIGNHKHAGQSVHRRPDTAFTLAVEPKQRRVITALYPPNRDGSRWTREEAPSMSREDLKIMATSWLRERRDTLTTTTEAAESAPRWSRSIATLGRELHDVRAELSARGVVES